MRNIILSLLIIFSACHSNKKETTYQIIPESKFVKLLIDYHLATGVSNSDFVRSKWKGYEKFTVSDSVLKYHGYTKAIFDSSVSFYASEPDKFDVMYDKVITELSRMQAKIQEKMAREKINKQEIMKGKKIKESSPPCGILKSDSLQNSNFNSIGFRDFTQAGTSDTTVRLPRIK
jgi:hypothetical protein